MTTPIGLPDDLTQLLQNNEVRPKGRRHRRDERQVYGGAYPSIINQSFDSERPPIQPQSSSPMNPYRQPRPSRPLPPQSRPSSVVATTGRPSRPASIAPSHTPVAGNHQCRPASTAIDQTSTPSRSLPAQPSASIRPLAHQPSVEEIGSWGDFAHIIPFVETEVEALLAQTVTRAPETLRQSHHDHEEVIVNPTVVTSGHSVTASAPSKSTQSATALPQAPSVAVAPTASIMGDLEDDISCPICMNVMVGACLLSPCGHGLCGPCIVPWLETRASTGEQTNCPVCRERVSKRHPLVPARNLEAVVNRWVEHKMKSGGWEGYDEWVERTETWKIHKKFTPSLISPELFNRHSHAHSHSPTTPGPETQSVFADPHSHRLQRAISPLDMFGSLPLMRSALLDGFFPDHRQSYFDTGNSYVHPPTIDPFQQLSEMGSRFEAIRNNTLQDMARSRQ